MYKNICNFIPHHSDYHSIHTINFVLETTPQVFNGLISQAVYKMYYVCTGTGVLHRTGKTIELKKGDVFFTFPSDPFAIESKEDFTYMYISFLGSRSNMIMDKMRITPSNSHFPDCGEVYDYWKNGLGVNDQLSDIMTESILLYTFCYLGDKLITPQEQSRKNSNIALVAKKYVDDNFTDCTLSLNKIAEQLFYSPKHISMIFKKTFNIGMSEYINTIRIQHSCTLMNQGFTSISDISNQCGYSDPQYFSKVFKKRMGMLPGEYIKSTEI